MSDGTTVTITDLLGTSIDKKIMGNYVDVSYFNAGVYFVSIIDNGKSFQGKFSKI